MKLTTKLLKEMIQQEMKHMEYGGDVFEPVMPQQGSVNYVAVGMDGREIPVDAKKAEMLMRQGYSKVRQDALDGSNDTTMFLYHPDSPDAPGNIPVPQGSAGDIVNH